MSHPRSIRFEPTTETHLAAFAGRHPGLSLSGAAALLVDEGLRSDAHPGVAFREGPAGRRAVVAGGPDVWEVVRAVRSARAAEPGLDSDELLTVVSENTGVPSRHLRIAIAYYTDYPDEVDEVMADADRAEQAAEIAAARHHALLGS